MKIYRIAGRSWEGVKEKINDFGMSTEMANNLELTEKLKDFLTFERDSIENVLKSLEISNSGFIKVIDLMDFFNPEKLDELNIDLEDMFRLCLVMRKFPKVHMEALEMLNWTLLPFGEKRITKEIEYSPYVHYSVYDKISNRVQEEESDFDLFFDVLMKRRKSDKMVDSQEFSDFLFKKNLIQFKNVLPDEMMELVDMETDKVDIEKLKEKVESASKRDRSNKEAKHRNVSTFALNGDDKENLNEDERLSKVPIFVEDEEKERESKQLSELKASDRSAKESVKEIEEEAFQGKEESVKEIEEEAFQGKEESVKEIEEEAFQGKEESVKEIEGRFDDILEEVDNFIKMESKKVVLKTEIDVDGNFYEKKDKSEEVQTTKPIIPKLKLQPSIVKMTTIISDGGNNEEKIGEKQQSTIKEDEEIESF